MKKLSKLVALAVSLIVATFVGCSDISSDPSESANPASFHPKQASGQSPAGMKPCQSAAFGKMRTAQAAPTRRNA